MHSNFEWRSFDLHSSYMAGTMYMLEVLRGEMIFYQMIYKNQKEACILTEYIL